MSKPTGVHALDVPRYRYWGDRKPPENRAEIFDVAVAAANVNTSTTDEGQTGSVATMRIYGPIDSWGGWFGVSAKDVAQALDALPADVTELRVRINSPGGEVWEGMAILNMLRAHRVRALAVVDGIAASAASVIASGCEETVMSPGTQLMIHDASGFAFGNADTMGKAQRFFDSTSDSIASIYAEAAGGDVAAWRALMREETWYTADEAVEAGLADRVDVVPDQGETSTAGDEPDVVVVPADPDEAEDVAAQVAARFDLSIYAHAGRSHAPAPKPPTASADGSTHTEGGPAVAFSDEQITSLRQKLGTAEDADEATILAALDEALAERAEPTSPAAAAQIPEGTVLVDAAVLDELKRGAADGRTAREQLDNAARDRAIQAAIEAGKMPANRREHWEKAWAADAEGTQALLDSLESGLVPLEERGHAEQTETAPELSDEALDAFVAGLGITKEALRG